MKITVLYVTLFSLLLMPPVLAQGFHRISDRGELPQTAASLHEQELVAQGEALLRLESYPAAEQHFRAALELANMGVPGVDPTADRGLAEALTAQGKTEEALHFYRMTIYEYPGNISSVAQELRTLMRYSILLSQTDQWPEAVSVYEKALPKATFGVVPKVDVHFDPQVPMPVQLQAMAHVAIGMEYSGHGANTEGYKEFEKGARLAPDSALTNYYYGYGLQHISPDERLQFATAQQARAALQKAVKYGKGDVKQAAKKALQVAMNTK